LLRRTLVLSYPGSALNPLPFCISVILQLQILTSSNFQIMDYTVPSNTHIGHVHLKVSDLQKALEFYNGLLGFQIMQLW